MINSSFKICLALGLAIPILGGVSRAQDAALKRIGAMGQPVLAQNDDDDDLAAGCKKSEYTKGCFGGKVQNCFTITGCNNPENNVGETCGQCN